MTIWREGPRRARRASRRGAIGAALAALWGVGVIEPAGAAARSAKRCRAPKGRCLCKAGEQCYGNSGCAQLCLEGSSTAGCASACECGSGVDVISTCFRSVDNPCVTLTQMCAATEDCPKGTACRSFGCFTDQGGRCTPLCRA
jgi:hypothetical protein